MNTHDIKDEKILSQEENKIYKKNYAVCMPESDWKPYVFDEKVNQAQNIEDNINRKTFCTRIFVHAVDEKNAVFGS